MAAKGTLRGLCKRHARLVFNSAPRGKDQTMREHKLKQEQTRSTIFTDLWVRHGCPKRMTIRVRRSGETITLLDGSPVTLSLKNNAVFMRTSEAQKRRARGSMPVTLTRTCKACKNDFRASRKTGRFCSTRCRVKFHRELESRRQHQETTELLVEVNYGSKLGAEALVGTLP